MSDRVQIDPKVLEIVKYNQLPDQNGFPHPNAYIFQQIQAELERLEKLANIPFPVEAKPPEPAADVPPQEFVIGQRFTIKKEYQGRGKCHPYGDRVWYVQHAKLDGMTSTRWQYYTKLDPQLNTGIPPGELFAKAAWREAYEMVDAGVVERVHVPQDTDFNMQAVDSSNIEAIGWSPEPGKDTGRLRVKFKNNSTYEYASVPGVLWEAFRAHESKGSFLANNIKGKFPTEKVK